MFGLCGVLIPVEDYIDPLVVCSHLEHSAGKYVAVVTKRSNGRRLSKCHHECLTINEQAAGLIGYNCCRGLHLLRQHVC